MEVTRPHQLALRTCWCALAAIWAVYFVQIDTGLLGDGATEFCRQYVYNGLLFAGALLCLWRVVAIPQDRFPWALMAIGIVSWSAADIFWTAVYANDPNAPYPS